MWRGGCLKKRGPGWKQTAAAARKRDKFTCLICGTLWTKGMRSFPVDHLIPYRLLMHWKEIGLLSEKDDPNDLRNLMTLCPSCHSKKTRVESKFIQGDLVGFTLGSLRQMNHERTHEALRHYGMDVTAEKFKQMWLPSYADSTGSAGRQNARSKC